jgi:hypothetical protein
LCRGLAGVDRRRGGVSDIADSIEDRFAVETELLGLTLLPGQEANLRTAYAALREAIALVGAGYPFGVCCLPDVIEIKP